MSSSPPKKGEAEPVVEGDQTTPDPSEQLLLEKPGGPMDPSDLTGHDIEVKEQDRWLPIANGMCLLIATAPCFLICALLRQPLTKIHKFLALLIRRCDLLCDNCRSNHNSAHSHFGETKQSNWRVRSRRTSATAYQYSFCCSRWRPRLSSPGTNTFTAGLVRNGRHLQCAAQQSCLPPQPFRQRHNHRHSSTQTSRRTQVNVITTLTFVTLLQLRES